MGAKEAGFDSQEGKYIVIFSIESRKTLGLIQLQG
jgi:hypothetical protein